MADESKSATPAVVEYKVPRLLWENFEAVLMAHSRRYIGELASYLGVPERELQKKVLPTSDSLKIMMMDSQNETNQCRAHLQVDNVTTLCRKPVAYQSEFCTHHLHRRINVRKGEHTLVVERIKPIPDREPVWIQGQSVINSNGFMVGKINKEAQRVKWFVVSE